ncbi:MAG: cupin domain-containing protein [Planctomycetaceae bacterium]|nr:cupin domain-containing protein [Planctomycetaceae bacterium]
MFETGTISLKRLELDIPKDIRPAGTGVFAELVSLAGTALQALHDHRHGRPLAVVSRLRGTGRGISLSRLLAELDRDHPIELVAPFEDSQFVSGAVWHGDDVLGHACSIAVAKLLWAPGAVDLPMHVHDLSDRFIIVRKGRGYFHVSDEAPEKFTGKSVRTIPARERDVFMFSRGVVHTFSTDKDSMELLSCQAPFVPFEDPDQYRLPAVRCPPCGL